MLRKTKPSKQRSVFQRKTSLNRNLVELLVHHKERDIVELKCYFWMLYLFFFFLNEVKYNKIIKTKAEELREQFRGRGRRGGRSF